MDIDLATRSVTNATLDEYVVTETSVSDRATEIGGYTVRHSLLRLVSARA